MPPACCLGAAFAFVLARSIVRPLKQAAGSARRIAAGELDEALRISGRDEAAELLQALRDMQGSLARVITSVRGSAENVASATTQIAQGNQDLSSRTEGQASALQQTAAAMEQLGSTVDQNADSARQASQLALNASTVAQRGGEEVGQVVRTMRGISDSSKKIADIIGVIDGIAFQTNILALNAAVEAARAGEQGRGFAVVASEVRSLAGRSAEAAKEIKTLITTSLERVEQGTSLVDQAGTTMTEVVVAIRRVTDLVGEISAASSEQSGGVAQIGTAVTQLDQATQQNAALVEEMAAAAGALKGQAQELVQAVGVFRLSQWNSLNGPGSGMRNARLLELIRRALVELPRAPSTLSRHRKLKNAEARLARKLETMMATTHQAPATAHPRHGAAGDSFRRAERERIERELRIAATAFEAHESMLITDRHKVILRVNRAFSEATGYAASEVVGKDAATVPFALP